MERRSIFDGGPNHTRINALLEERLDVARSLDGRKDRMIVRLFVVWHYTRHSDLGSVGEALQQWRIIVRYEDIDGTL